MEEEEKDILEMLDRAKQEREREKNADFETLKSEALIAENEKRVEIFESILDGVKKFGIGDPDWCGFLSAYVATALPCAHHSNDEVSKYLTDVETYVGKAVLNGSDEIAVKMKELCDMIGTSDKMKKLLASNTIKGLFGGLLG